MQVTATEPGDRSNCHLQTIPPPGRVRMPSIVLDGEFNYLLNPRHQDPVASTLT